MDRRDEDVIIACGLYLLSREEKQEKRRKYWIHNIFRAREEEGEFHTIFGRLKDDGEKFFRYFRMSVLKFENLKQLLQPEIERKNTRLRRSISPEERLALTLRFLASGNSQMSVSYSYRIAPSTVHSIVISTCEAIWMTLSPIELPQHTEEIWKNIAEEFYSIWQFPNYIGAIVGKHIQIRAPHNSGSLFFNYKNTFSVVLLALVDANYKFVIIDVGGYGKSSDGGLFSRSVLGKSLEANALSVPSPKPLPNSDEPLPFVIVGDEAFPLKRYLLRPYPGNSARNDESKKIYNYRLSRARRVVENAFGILTQKFRKFYGRIQLSPENTDKVIMAACALHNYLRNDSSVEGFEIGNTDPTVLSHYFTTFRRLGGNPSEEATSVREKYRDYFENVGAVPWQLEAIRRGTTAVN